MTRAIIDILGLALLVPVYYWIVREEWQRRGVFRWNESEDE